MHFSGFCHILVVGVWTISASIVDSNTRAELRARTVKEHAQFLERRASPDLAFCYGENAICSVANEMFDACNAFETLSDPTPWYQCLCSNGYVSTRIACYWCDTAYGIPPTGSASEWEGYCSKYGSATIAPIPASVLSVESKWNATYTGIISGAAQTKGSSTATTTTTTDPGVTSTSIRSVTFPNGGTSTTSGSKTTSLGGSGGIGSAIQGSSSSSVSDRTTTQTFDGGLAGLPTTTATTSQDIATVKPTTSVTTGTATRNKGLKLCAVFVGVVAVAVAWI